MKWLMNIWRLPAYLAMALIRMYQWLLSPLLVPACRFEPSCSRYAYASFEKHGFFKGIALTAYRLGRCHPWHPGGIDPVPERLWKGKKCGSHGAATGTCSQQGVEICSEKENLL